MTRLLAGVLVALCCFQLSLSVSTTTVAHQVLTTHRKPESAETHQYRFQYDPETHMLLVHIDDSCYIWTLTNHERTDIHTSNGLRAVEQRVLKEIDHALYTAVDPRILAGSIKLGCFHAIHYFVVH